MTQQISLNGSDWLLKDYYGEDWRWRDAHRPDSPDKRGWRPATVPGSIYADLFKNGEIPDPYFEMNSRLIEWVPARTWLFKRTFHVDEELRGKRCWLCFQGIDYEAEIFLNGVSLGTHRGMYTSAEFEVTDKLIIDGENLVAVVVEHAPDEQPQVGRTSRVRTHKSRMSYWWDFCPRMIQIGLWDSVSLLVSCAARIENVFVQSRLNGTFDHATITTTTAIESSRELELNIDYRLLYDGQIVAIRRARQVINGRFTITEVFELDQPHLWWPNGYGNPALYTLEVRLTDAVNYSESDFYSLDFGIRDLKFVSNDGAPADALPYTLMINGQKIYINGWNWVPKNVNYGLLEPEKLDRLLALARRAHVNLLRVWGGGLIETEAFYTQCDRLGLLIWQEFILSSSAIENLPPDDPAIIATLMTEVEQIVPRKRNHPALAWWCGGNELQYGDEHPIDAEHPFIAALKNTVARLDPDRAFLPTSASGPVFSFNRDNMAHDSASLHDVHGPWEFQGLAGQYALYNEVRCLLHSEFGAEGLTNLRTLERTLSAANRWPVTLDNPVWNHLGAWWVKESTWRQALGERSSLPELVQGTQFLQAEAMRYAVEAHGRDRFHNSGSLLWQFNEPYPMAACTSAVDFYSQPKPLYYAVARSYEPIHVSAELATQSWVDRTEFAADLWITTSGKVQPDSVVLDARLIDASGHIFASQSYPLAMPSNAAQHIGSFQASLAEDLGDLFLLDLILHLGDSDIRGQYVFTRAETFAPMYELPLTRLAVESVADEITITNVGKYVAFMVWLEDVRNLSAVGYVYFSDDYFCLLPGEQRTIRVLWTDVPEVERQISIQSWNTKALIIDNRSAQA